MSIVDSVLDSLQVASTAFRFVASTGLLPQNNKVKMVSDIVRVVAVLIPAIEAQIERLREMKASGVELSEAEWMELGFDVTDLENDLLDILSTSRPGV